MRTAAVYREKVRGMFKHGMQQYMAHAFPKDELLPLSCKGKNTYGGYALTLVDALDTMAVLGEREQFRRGVEYVVANVTFEGDYNVSVFETTIRVLGGLLSAHQLAADPELALVPGYTDGLLLKARDLADKLLPAFNTPTSIPIGTVNLKTGVPEGETREANTAGAGSLILEWGLLSRLTGDPKYEEAAAKSMESLWSKRSALGLVGGHINVDTGDWTEQTSGIGASVDSFYEYMLKGYLLLGYQKYLKMFAQAYQAVMKHQHKEQWYVDVNIFSGAVVQTVFNSLSAFWPGLQAMLGEVDEASRTLSSFFEVWRQFGFTPEGYNFATRDVHESQSQYPLRPEMAESAWYLYQATKDPAWQQAGMDMVDSIEAVSKVECGFAAVADVRTHELEDVLDSFFYAETIKYLFMLFEDLESNPVLAALEGQFILNTEGHILRMNQSFHMGVNQSNFANHACRRPSFLRRMAVDGLQPPQSTRAQPPPVGNATMGCSKCGHLVASSETEAVGFPPETVSSHYQVTAHGTMLVHKLKDPHSKSHELTMLPAHTDHLKFGQGVEDTQSAHDPKVWKSMSCGKCGHSLGFGFERHEHSKMSPTHFHGFFPEAVTPMSSPELYPKLSKIEFMMKFLGFTQQSLGRLSQPEIASVAVDGRALVLFEDPVAGFIEYLNHGTLLGAKQLLPPSQQATLESDLVSWPEKSPQGLLRSQIQEAIEQGLSPVQQQPLLDLLNKGMLVVLVKDLDNSNEAMGEHPSGALTLHPLDGSSAVNMSCMPSSLGQQNRVAGEGQFRDGKPILVPVAVRGELAIAEPREGCTALVGPRERWAGKVVLLERGLCTFVVKMHFAQQAGASATIVRNTVKGEPSLVMGSDPNHDDWEADLTVPAAMISEADGQVILDNPGSQVSLTVTPPEDSSTVLQPEQPPAATEAAQHTDDVQQREAAQQEAEAAQQAGVQQSSHDSRYFSSEDP